MKDLQLKRGDKFYWKINNSIIHCDIFKCEIPRFYITIDDALIPKSFVCDVDIESKDAEDYGYFFDERRIEELSTSLYETFKRAIPKRMIKTAVIEFINSKTNI